MSKHLHHAAMWHQGAKNASGGLRRLEDATWSDDFFSNNQDESWWWEPLHSLYNDPYEGFSNLDRALVGRQGHSMTSYRLQDDNGMWREFLIVTGGFGDWAKEILFPVWAYELTDYSNAEGTPLVGDESINRWIDLSGRFFGSRHGGRFSTFTTAKDERPPPGTWPEGRVGHLSHATSDGVLFVWGGTKVQPGAHDPQCEGVPYVWRTTLPRDVLLRKITETPFEFPPKVKELFLKWERILPNVVLKGGAAAPSSPPSNHQCWIVKEPNSTVEEDLTQFWDLNHEQWNEAERQQGPTKIPIRKNILIMQRLRRSHAKGGPWYPQCMTAGSTCHAANASSESFLMYGGLYRLLVVEETNTNTLQDTVVVQWNQVLGDVWSLHFDTCTFTLLFAMEYGTEQDRVMEQRKDQPPPRTRHAATVINNRQLVISGGWTSDVATTFASQGRALNDIWRLDIEKQHWTQLMPTFPTGVQSDHALVALKSGGDNGQSPSQDVVVAFGGCYRAVLDKIQPEMHPCRTSSDLYMLPMSTGVNLDVWFLRRNGAKPSPPRRSGHSAVVDSSGRMHVWGGNPDTRNDKFDTLVWRLDLPFDFKDAAFQIPAETGADDVVDIFWDPNSWIFQLTCAAATVGVVVLAMHYYFGVLRNRQAANQPPTGLSMAEIQSLPVRQHQETPPPVDKTSSDEDINRDDGCCPICLVEYVNGDSLRCLPCQHEFHQACVDSWFMNHGTCPSCRHAVLGGNQHGDAGGATATDSSTLATGGRTWSVRGVLSRTALQRALQTRRLRRRNEGLSSTMEALATDEVAPTSSIETVPTHRPRLTNRRQGRYMMDRLRTSLRYMARSQQEWDTATSNSSDLSLDASVNQRNVGEEHGEDEDANGDGMERYQNVTEMVALA